MSPFRGVGGSVWDPLGNLIQPFWICYNLKRVGKLPTFCGFQKVLSLVYLAFKVNWGSGKATAPLALP